MAIRYKFKFLEKEILNINNILSESGVTFSFEDIQNYISALEKISPVIYQSYVRYAQFLKSTISKSGWQELIEYDINDMTIISNGVGYPSKFINYCPFSQVKEGIILINDVFSEYECDILDNNANYGIMFRGDEQNRYEGCYYWINKDLFSNSTIDMRKTIIKKLKIPTNHAKFIRLFDDEDIILSYVGFSKLNRINKYSFMIPSVDFESKNPKEYYSQFKNISFVCEIIQKDRLLDAVSIQLAPESDRYFALEIALDKTEILNYLQYLVDYKLLDNNKLSIVANFVAKKDYSNQVTYILKFRWDGENFKIKLYSEDLLYNKIIPLEIDFLSI